MVTAPFEPGQCRRAYLGGHRDESKLGYMVNDVTKITNAGARISHWGAYTKEKAIRFDDGTWKQRTYRTVTVNYTKQREYKTRYAVGTERRFSHFVTDWRTETKRVWGVTSTKRVPTYTWRRRWVEKRPYATNLGRRGLMLATW